YPQPPLGPSPASAGQMADYLQAVSNPGIYDRMIRDWGIFVALSLFVSLLLITLIVYCIVRILQIRRMERIRFEAAQQTVAAHDIPKTQLRWNRIREEASSDDEQKHRLAILEADIMLNELLDTLGYKGETMGDKMRQVERGSFNTIDFAWEAHRARNTIAHQGSGTPLSAHEARRIIMLYERVFREFKFVQ
ncbi:MAG TPA: hypothetical protein VN495_00985, partial [Candidatus Paceibacterota bacterium]|nr:hypothetical protein [Candidatus Paceibacterota bacterium]